MHAENIADLALRNSALDELVDRIIPVIECYLWYSLPSTVILLRNNLDTHGNVFAELSAGLVDSTALLDCCGHGFFGDHPD
jgi:hypothetical protein